MRKLVAIAALTLVACTAQEDAGTASDPGEQLFDDPDAGALNSLTTGMVRDAADLVTDGRVYRLGIVTGPETPAFGDRSYSVEIIDLGTFGPNLVTGNDDLVTTHLGIGTQIDGLGHIGIDGVHYNGVSRDEIVQPDGLVRYGAENIPPIVTRGVMIDMAAYRGVDVNEPMDSFGAADLQAAAEAQGVEIREGDVVLVHTGWLNRIDETELFVSQAPGINGDAARWLAEVGVVAVGSDSASGESNAPDPDGVFLPVHATLIAENGIYILETVDTRELAADGVHEFMFVLGAPRMQGTVQAIINPIAIR